MKQIQTFRIIVLLTILLTTLHSTAQDILWEKSFGGRQADYLLDAQPTLDNGFILAGSSLSRKSGNKTEAGKGDLDYIITKMDQNGKFEWQKSFGGSGTDLLQSIELTSDGGYILAGTSNSPKGLDKKEEGFGGNDFWIIKLNALGREEWQQTLGGLGEDNLSSIRQVKGGGYIVGGSSNSGAMENSANLKYLQAKSEDTCGNMDYWILYLDTNGEISWQKTYGGNYADLLRVIEPTNEGGYIVGGYSNSTISCDKSDENLGDGGDMWILKLDEKGLIQWQKTIGGENDEQLSCIKQTIDGGYIIGGNSNSARTSNGDKINGNDFLVLKLDYQGEIEWSSPYDFGPEDILTSIIENSDATFVVAGYSAYSSHSIQKGQSNSTDGNDYIIIKIKSNGEKIWEKKVGSKGEDVLKKAFEMRDGSFLLAGTSNPEAENNKGISSLKNNFFNNEEIDGVAELKDYLKSEANAYIADDIDDIKKKLKSANDALNNISERITVQLPDENSIIRQQNGSSRSTLSRKDQGSTNDIGAKKNLNASKDKTINFGNRDFWVVKLKEKDQKLKNSIEIEASPNPTKSFTNVIIPFNYTDGTATLFDLSGRLLQSLEIKNQIVPIDLSQFPEGIYIINIKTDKGTGSVKVMKSGIN